MNLCKEELTGRTVLITGASGGLGRSAAVEFAKMGDRVAIHYNQQSVVAMALEAELLLTGHCVKAFQADLTDSLQVNRLYDEVEALFGAVEVLINCAGFSEQALCQEITDEAWRKTMSINLDASFYCCRRAIPLMIEAHKGVILNISSIWGMTGASMEVHYATAKAAIIGMTKAMAKELGPSQIRVNCLAPGWVETEMNSEHDTQAQNAFINETPLGRIGTPEEMAKWMWFLCSPEASFMTGQVISPNGGVVV